MAYGAVVTVPAPIESYLASHAEVERAIGDRFPDGLILHVARPVEGGFEIFEVWESKEQSDRFNEQVMRPAAAKSGQDMSGPPAAPVEFEPVGLMVAAQLT